MTSPVAAKPAARSLIVAPRLPPFPKAYGDNPFTTVGQIVAECDTTLDGKPCGYKAMGSRSDVGKAMAAHRKMFHSEQIGVVLLNQPRQ